MERLGEEKKMSVKEVAEAIGYEKDYLRKKVKELFPESVQNGVETMLTEEQVFDLKKSLVPRTLDLKVQGENAVTSLDIEEMTLKVLQYHMDKVVQLKAENERQRLQINQAEQKIALDAPKVADWDKFASHETFINFRDAASKLGKTQKEFMDFLRTKYIYKNARQEYRAYAEYQLYFSLRPFSSNSIIGSQLMLTAGGLSFFDRLMNGEK